MELPSIAACGSIGGYSCDIYVSINYKHLKKKYDQTGDPLVFTWYKAGTDYDAASVTATREGTTSARMSGAREGIKTDSFKDTDTFVMADEYLRPFIQELHAINMQNDDYIKEVMSCGINVMRVWMYPEGGMTRQVFFGSGSADLPRVISSIYDGDEQVTMTVTHNTQPLVMSAGLLVALPDGMTAPAVTQTIVTNPTTLTITPTSYNAGTDLVGDPIIVPTAKIAYQLWSRDDVAHLELLAEWFGGATAAEYASSTAIELPLDAILVPGEYILVTAAQPDITAESYMTIAVDEWEVVA